MQKTIFSLTSDRGLGGISISLLTYSRAMALAGIRHIIAVPRITPVYAELAKMENVELIELNSTALGFHSRTHYRFAPMLRRVMAEVDALFIHNAKHTRVPAGFRGKTYVINHNGKTKLLDRAPNIIFLNKTARDQFLKDFPTLTTHHLVMGHGFDIFDEVLRTYTPGKPVQIISAGRLMEKKGFRDLVETARILQANKVHCHISIYGEGPDETYLKERIAEYELTNITINGWTNHLRTELAKADIFCSPSHGESFPLVLGEALEAGLAIAATKTNGAKGYFENVEPEKPIGLLSEISDAEGMAQALTQLINDHRLRQNMNKNARSFLLNNFSLNILADHFKQICNETRKRPRIFMATQTFPPRIGGMEYVMRALAEKLSQTGHDVTVMPNHAYTVPSSFRVINIRLIKPLRIIAKRFILKQMLTDADVVICDSWKSINVITRRFKGRLIVLAHGQEFLKGKKSAKSIQTALERSFRVVANSAFTAGLIRDRYDIDPQKIVIIPPTYMLEKTAANSCPEKEHGSVKLISICRLDPRKGLLQTMTALGQDQSIKNHWHWTIIGKGEQASELKSTAIALGLDRSISFMHDINDAEKDRLLACADLFVMPSFQNGNSVEGFGISYVEAARMGVPSIAGKAGGSSEAVLDKETGWCVDSANTDDLLKVLKESIDAPEIRAQRGMAALRRFETEFDGHVVFKQFVKKTITLEGD
ncbi:glycosyltransferase family 4 protein [Alphaproteobacteria bacterium]|nr:glycosyltransferase family 4 protein [Alphaproteobacteria bacterium]